MAPLASSCSARNTTPRPKAGCLPNARQLASTVQRPHGVRAAPMSCSCSATAALLGPDSSLFHVAAASKAPAGLKQAKTSSHLLAALLRSYARHRSPPNQPKHSMLGLHSKRTLQLASRRTPEMKVIGGRRQAGPSSTT